MRKPWLWLPPQLAHDLVPWTLPLITPFVNQSTPSFRPFQWKGLTFKNPLGIAGGVDKSGASLLQWQKLGTGFVEVGTVTPFPQSANPGTILRRDIATETVWNKMGFPNSGAVSLAHRLQKIKGDLKIPLFVNIGKNRQTENEKAHEDYLKCLSQLSQFADVFVINVSSPNTQGLRLLASPENLSAFLQPLFDYKEKYSLPQPFLIKLSPDMEEKDLINVIDTSLRLGIDGWILTNTTLARPENNIFPTEGGLSGAFLRDRSKNVLRECLQQLRPVAHKNLIVSAGGIADEAEALERMEMGAHLLQVYSALIFQGPLFFHKLLNRLKIEEQTLII
jgi:dihydroorotate dehydrogenase